MNITSEFERRKFRTLQEAEEAHNKLTDQLQAMKRDILSGVANVGNVTINIGSTPGGSSSGGGSSSTLGFLRGRSRTESLVANTPKPITFSSPMGAVFSIPSLRLIDTNGYTLQEYTLTSITANGFTITAPADCTLYYLAVEEK